MTANGISHNNDDGNSCRLNKPVDGVSTFLRTPYIENVTDFDADIATSITL